MTISSHVLGSSLDSINIVKMLEEYTIYYYKKLNSGGSDLTNVAFALAKQFHPLFDKVSKLIDSRADIVEEFNQLIESGSLDVDALSQIEKRLPMLSARVINTRSFHKILAAQARFTKIAIALGRNDLGALSSKFNIVLTAPNESLEK